MPTPFPLRFFVCEPLLRLQANYLWPAMLPGTQAFNLYPTNKLVADDYAIVMGSSHAEPMLRNNVDDGGDGIRFHRPRGRSGQGDRLLHPHTRAQPGDEIGILRPLDRGVFFDKIVFELGGRKPSHPGPPEYRSNHPQNVHEVPSFVSPRPRRLYPDDLRQIGD